MKFVGNIFTLENWITFSFFYKDSGFRWKKMEIGQLELILLDFSTFCFLHKKSYLCHFIKAIRKSHGRIIKWTQHVSFLTLAGMEWVVEGNHRNDSKEEFCVYRVCRNLIMVYIFIFMSVNKTNACMCYIVS